MNPTKQSHAKNPYYAYLKENTGYVIKNKDNEVVASGLTSDDGIFIVKAVNENEKLYTDMDAMAIIIHKQQFKINKLVEALRLCLNQIRVADTELGQKAVQEAKEKAEEALKQAEE